MCFEKIYRIWEKYEKEPLENINESLDNLVKIGKEILNLNSYYKDFYDEIYKIYSDKIIVDISWIYEFLLELSKVSTEAYVFLTNGNDIINLKEYLSFKDCFIFQRVNKCVEFMEFAEYIKYAFKKILNENSEIKKRSMLKGLLGM